MTASHKPQLLSTSEVKSCNAWMAMAGAAHIELHIQLLLGMAALPTIQSNQTVMDDQRTDWMIYRALDELQVRRFVVH